MPRAVTLDRALTAAGLDVVVYEGWQTRGNAYFQPRGVVVHHTGPWSSVQGMVQLCLRGRSDLQGPLCHVVLDPAGTCHLLAAGRANHAGTGGWRGLSDNRSVFGIEAIHKGDKATPWPQAQVDAFIVCAGAMAKLVGAGADMVCAHREWTPRKIDPIGIDMNRFRVAVDAWMKAPPQTAPIVTAPKEGVVAVNRPPVKLLSHPSWNGGYIIVTDDGGVFAFDAPFFGSAASEPLNRPVIDGEVTPSGQGYWLMAGDGGIFAFGDAPYRGRVEYRA